MILGGIAVYRHTLQPYEGLLTPSQSSYSFIDPKRMNGLVGLSKCDWITYIRNIAPPQTCWRVDSLLAQRPDGHWDHAQHQLACWRVDSLLAQRPDGPWDHAQHQPACWRHRWKWGSLLTFCRGWQHFQTSLGQSFHCTGVSEDWLARVTFVDWLSYVIHVESVSLAVIDHWNSSTARGSGLSKAAGSNWVEGDVLLGITIVQRTVLSNG